MIPDVGRARSSTSAITRRAALRLGGSSVLAATLSRLLGAGLAQSAVTAGTRSISPIKSCILIFYYGGPSHLDTWDLKPDAPAEVRGEFRGIATRVPGLFVSEHLQRSAIVADKLAIVRSMHHAMRGHNAAAYQALCGRAPAGGDVLLLSNEPNAFPPYGAALSFLSPRQDVMPSHVALPHVMFNVVELPGQKAGFLGPSFNPVQVTRDPNEAGFRLDELALPDDMPRVRLVGRKKLWEHLDSAKSAARRQSANLSLAQHQRRAFDLLESDDVRRAFDLTDEPEAMRDRYGRNKLGQSMLLARRLVASGVRFVNVNDKVRNSQLTNWDSHENNFARLKDDLLPPADQAFSALIEDLDAQGLLDSTLVVAIGEFGRTPRINTRGGRDHWPDCFSAVMAGGGVQGGAVYGASDAMGAYPDRDPVSTGDLAATIFWRFGLDASTPLRDLTDRPFHLAEGSPLTKLFTGAPAAIG